MKFKSIFCWCQLQLFSCFWNSVLLHYFIAFGLVNQYFPHTSCITSILHSYHKTLMWWYLTSMRCQILQCATVLFHYMICNDLCNCRCHGSMKLYHILRDNILVVQHFNLSMNFIYWLIPVVSVSSIYPSHKEAFPSSDISNMVDKQNQSCMSRIIFLAPWWAA